MKKLFSRSTFVILTILLLFLVDAAILVGLVYGLQFVLARIFPEASQWIALCVAAFLWLVQVIAVLNVVSRNMVPEAKVPWIICIIALNLVGVIIYVLFSFQKPKRKQRKLYARLLSRVGVDEVGLSEEEAKAKLQDWTPVSRALRYEVGAAVYQNTATKFYPMGELFFEDFKNDLRKAKKYIFMEYFIIERGKMWNEILQILLDKVKEGVEVRVTYDDIGSMAKLPAGYAKRLRKQGIKCHKFNPFVPIVSNVHNNRDHRKITVIDGTVGYTGGLNLADEYINETHPFGVWKDSAVRMEGEGVRGLLAMYLRMFCLSTNTEEDFTPYFNVEYPKLEGEGYVQPYGAGPRPVFPTSVGENVYLNLINGAKKSVWVTTPYLIVDYRFIEALVRAAKRGVDVRVITPHIPDKKTVFLLTRSNYKPLIEGGVKVYEYTPGFIHAKQMLVDGEAGVVGTINLDYRSLIHHFENAVLLFQTTSVTEMEQDFIETFEISERQTLESCKMGVFSRALCHVCKVFAPLF